MNDEGKRLAEVVKGTHKRLRRRYKLGEDETQVWQQHIQHVEELHTYANAMHTLATQHWEPRQQVNTSRVTWVHNAIMQYFHGGDIQRTTDKEMRKLEHLGLKMDESNIADRCKVLLTSRVKVLDVGSCYNPFLVYKEFDVMAVDLCPAHPSVKKCDFLSLEVVKKPIEDNPVKTDVHSHPKLLLQSDKHESTSKITSVTTDTLQDTKLLVSDISNTSQQATGKVELTEPISSDKNSKEGATAAMPEATTNSKSTPMRILDGDTRLSTGMSREGRCSPEMSNTSMAEWSRSVEVNENVEPKTDQVPRDETVACLEGGSFDAVVFCLLLEYLPSPKHRFLCCQKAYNLLRHNGILCVITPDSKHQNANVHLYKLWKITLGYIGFSRTKYEKLTHFHGMVFRKGLYKEAWRLDAARELSLMKKTIVKNKFVGINYDKIDSEVYIPQDFQDVSDSEEETR
ncbi:S-adenosylmethionine sensor upstream of mTORC1-like isoform X2 [Homarus americanus]|uniref:S-adenosylmethionine sensor upstream of mTORC1 n=1 Tax=Homarus americanus TaxID=6706 RepID=A0A8J5TJG1_HOMAM|nr:S-adenosylmethionine sensor upstream of mTORC1-like isoform X2 [Homarus americanus]KAG7176654.1 S-adenosylmethionine sensor upstream of mTORC1-like [Homarus americanus]